jgi:hypothetical protein
MRASFEGIDQPLDPPLLNPERRLLTAVSAEEWQRKTKHKVNLAEFFAASPLRGSELKSRRSKEGPREVEL